MLVIPSFRHCSNKYKLDNAIFNNSRVGWRDVHLQNRSLWKCFICCHILTCAQYLDLATAWISLNMGCCWDCRGVTTWMTAVNSWDGLLPAEITNMDSRNDFSAFGQSVFEFLFLNHKAHNNSVFAHCERQISLYEISLQRHQPPVCNIFLHLYQFA